VAKNISANKKTSGLRLWGIALKRMQLNANGVVFSYLTKKDLAAVGADSEEASGIVNLINTVPGSRMALLLIESPDGKIKASLRTEEEGVDVSKFARLFGGGGHRKAAGFTVEDSLESLTAKI
jgi:phosphoesterase RecJ-like protein